MSRDTRLATALLLVGALTGCASVPGTAIPADPLPSTPTSTTSTQPPEPASFTVLAGGDVLIHPELTEQAIADSATAEPDFGPLFAGIRDAVSAADLALCHLEVPLGEPDGPFSGYPTFNAPPQVATALADVGYDSCTTASNHTLDQGEKGVIRTLDALDAAGLSHTGSARSAEEAAAPLIHDLGFVRVAQVAFTYGFNGIPLPEGAPWMASRLDAEAVLEAARSAVQAGADVVIVSLHWGKQYRTAPTARQDRLAERLLADPAIDLIIGHHAHVVQPFERIDGEWVAYGLGNQVAKHDEPRGTTEEGVMARFTFTNDAAGEWAVTKAEYLPALVDLGPPIRLLDLTKAPATARTELALRRIDEAVLSLGAAADGLTRPNG